MTLQKTGLIYAYEKGYRVKDNTVYSPFKNQPLKSQCSVSGYLYFNVNINKKIVKVFLHRLVAYEKYQNKLFEQGIIVRHLNGNNKDNTFNNICLGTQTENMLDRNPKERLKHAIKASSSIRKFTNDETKQIRTDHSKGLGYKALMQKYSISSKGTLHYILNNNYVT